MESYNNVALSANKSKRDGRIFLVELYKGQFRGCRKISVRGFDFYFYGNAYFL